MVVVNPGEFASKEISCPSQKVPIVPVVPSVRVICGKQFCADAENPANTSTSVTTYLDSIS